MNDQLKAIRKTVARVVCSIARNQAVFRAGVLATGSYQSQLWGISWSDTVLEHTSRVFHFCCRLAYLHAHNSPVYLVPFSKSHPTSEFLHWELAKSFFSALVFTYQVSCMELNRETAVWLPGSNPGFTTQYPCQPGQNINFPVSHLCSGDNNSIYP